MEVTGQLHVQAASILWKSLRYLFNNKLGGPGADKRIRNNFASAKNLTQIPIFSLVTKQNILPI
jgi:hypothetical protein